MCLAILHLKNERINEFEAGFEAGFFNNRISLEASFYSKKTIDGIIPTCGYCAINRLRLQQV
jgi:hypothetical protein